MFMSSRSHAGQAERTGRRYWASAAIFEMAVMTAGRAETSAYQRAAAGTCREKPHRLMPPQPSEVGDVRDAVRISSDERLILERLARPAAPSRPLTELAVAPRVAATIGSR